MRNRKAAPLAHVSFVISGEDVQLKYWNSYFQAVPHLSIMKGDPIFDRNGRMRDIKRRIGVWSFDSEGVVQSDTLEPHFRFLFVRLGLPRADLREKLQQQCASARLFCFWVNESGERVPDIPDDIRTMADAMGVDIDIDEYR